MWEGTAPHATWESKLQGCGRREKRGKAGKTRGENREKGKEEVRRPSRGTEEGMEKTWTLRKDKTSKFSHTNHVLEANPQLLYEESLAHPMDDPWGGSAYHHTVSEGISFQANTQVLQQSTWPLSLLISKHLDPTVLIKQSLYMLTTCQRGEPLSKS